MTNEQFKEIYDNSLYHAWVTSKDATKAAEQKRKQQEYNRKYYQNNKDKWHKETESQGLGTGSGTYRFRDERDRKENASAMARQAAGDIRRQQEEATARERWEEKQRQQNVRDLAQKARRELGTQNLKSNEAKGMEASARARRNRRVSENRRSTESEQMAKTRQQQNIRNAVRQKQIKESNIREDTFRTSSQRRKTGADAERLAKRNKRFKNETNAYNDAVKQRKLARDRKNARKSSFQTGFRELSTEKVRNRSHSDNASMAEQNARHTTYSNRRLKNGTIQKKVDKIRNNRTKVNDFKKNRAANEAAAYAVNRTLASQIRKQKARRKADVQSYYKNRARRSA